MILFLSPYRPSYTGNIFTEPHLEFLECRRPVQISVENHRASALLRLVQISRKIVPGK